MTLAVSLCMHFQILSNSEDKRPDKTISDISVNLFKRRYEFHGFRHLDRVMWSTNARMSMDYACFINMILVLANLFSNHLCRCPVLLKEGGITLSLPVRVCGIVSDRAFLAFLFCLSQNDTEQIQSVIGQYLDSRLYPLPSLTW